MDELPRIQSTDLIDELLEVHGRDVLDIGCGEGWLARRLTGAGARVVGVDPQTRALQRARAAGAEPAINYVQAAAQELPIPDASFDLVIFFNSLHHVPANAMDAALVEAVRVLRPSGLIFVQEPLAAGELFTLLRSIEDETTVRAQALAALERAAAAPLTEVTRREAINTVRIAGFEAFCERMTNVDPARAAAIHADADALRARYESLGRPCDGGREFDQPIRAYLFKLSSHAWRTMHPHRDPPSLRDGEPEGDGILPRGIEQRSERDGGMRGFAEAGHAIGVLYRREGAIVATGSAQHLVPCSGDHDRGDVVA